MSDDTKKVLGADGNEVNPEEPKEEKTTEQIAGERLERYKANPDKFFEDQEVVCLVYHNSKSKLGMSFLVGQTNRPQLDIAQAELNHLISKLRMKMDIDSEMKQQQANKIIPVPGAMKSFANKVMGKRK